MSPTDIPIQTGDLVVPRIYLSARCREVLRPAVLRPNAEGIPWQVFQHRGGMKHALLSHFKSSFGCPETVWSWTSHLPDGSTWPDCHGLTPTVSLSGGVQSGTHSSVCFSPITLESRAFTKSLVFPRYCSHLPLHKCDFSLLCGLSGVFLGEPRCSICFV